MTPSATTALPAALDALVEVGTRAGLDEATVRSEGTSLAAAVIEQAGSQVHIGWSRALGVSETDFFEQAPRGRRYAGGPTALLATLAAEKSPEAAAYAQALSDVAVAACTVDGAGQGAVGRATTVAHAQQAALGSASGATGSGMPSGPGLPYLAPPSALPRDTLPGASHRSSLDLPGGRSEQIAEAQSTTNRILGQLQALQEATLEMVRHRREEPGSTPQVPGAPQLPTPQFPTPDGPGTPPPAGGIPPAGPGAPGGPLAPQDPASPGAPVATENAPAPTDPAAPATPPEPEKSVEELLAELDELVGLTAVKREIHRQVALLKIEAKRQEAGLKTATLTRHLVFTGNPGTGKTTVARLVGGIYKALGLLSKGQLIEVDRSELVAGYLGQTAVKTADVVKTAIGGVLFIDEAYSLAGDQYGKEAVDTLVKEMEDHRDDLVVIVAGYPAPMQEFIDTNPGLASRFRTIIDFADYTDDEITGILMILAEKNDYDISDDAEQRFRELLAAEPRNETFGNGRYARNMLEAAIGRHAWRLRDIEDPTVEQLRTLEREDFEDREDEPPAAAPAEGTPSDEAPEDGTPEAAGPADDEAPTSGDETGGHA
ncbi:MAG: AAA family ATPase [Micrococcales bacterium]|nr:AAA family ATPase [Micrococcales bacterium]